MVQAPKTQYVFLNRTSKLWCPVKGAPAPYIVWRKDGVTVQNSTSITFRLKVTSENNVNYSCEVRGDGEVSRRNMKKLKNTQRENGTCSLTVLVKQKIGYIHIEKEGLRGFVWASISKHARKYSTTGYIL